MMKWFLLFLGVIISRNYSFCQTKIHYNWKNYSQNFEFEVPKIYKRKIFYSKVNQFDLVPQRMTTTLIKTSFKKKKFNKNHIIIEKLKLRKTKLSSNKIVAMPQMARKDLCDSDIKYLNRNLGFFSNLISNVAQDAEGYIWIASCDNGLLRYNGKKAIHYTKISGLPSNVVSQICIDSRNRVWLHMPGEIGFILNDTYYKVAHFKGIWLATMDISSDNNEIFIGTWYSGFYAIKGDEITHYKNEVGLEKNEVSSIAKNSAGNIVVGYWSKGFDLIKDNDIFHFEFQGSKDYDNRITLVNSKDNVFWIGTYSHGLMKFQDGKISKVNILSGKERVYSIVFDKSSIWIADFLSGVIKIKENNEIEHFTLRNGLPHSSAFRLALDSRKNIWVSGLHWGFARIGPTYFVKDTNNLHWPNAFYQEDKDKIWHFNNGGFSLSYKNKKDLYWLYNKEDEQVPMLLHVNSFFKIAKNQFYLGSYGSGLIMKDDRFFKFYNFKKTDDFFSICEGNEKEVFFGTKGYGIVVYNKVDKRFHWLTTKNGLCSSIINCIFKDSKNRIWIGTHKGITIYKGNKCCVIDKLTVRETGEITQIIEDKKHRIWIGTMDDGIFVLEDNLVHHFTVSDGLKSDDIRSILQLKNGDFFIGTSEGITLLQNEKNLKFKVTNIGIHHFPHLNDLTQALLERMDGKIDFGTKVGGFEFNIKDFKIEQPTLKVIKYTINKSNFISNESEIKMYESDTLSIFCQAFDWGFEEKLKVEYKMTGRATRFGKIWQEFDENEGLTFQNLDPGDYIVMVRANGVNGYSKVITIEFEVKPLWYNTMIFRVFGLLLLICLVVYIYLTRVKFLKNKSLQLEKIIEEKTAELKTERNELLILYENQKLLIDDKDTLLQEVHHRIKNNLQQISSLLDLQKRSVKSEEGAAALNEAYRRVISMSTVHELLYSFENVSVVNSKDFFKKIIEMHIEMYASEKLQLEMQYDIDPINLNTNVAIALGMILSEAFSNSIKHAFKSNHQFKNQVQIYFKRKEDYFEFVMKDNGVGIDIEHKDNSFGLRLIKIFAQKLKAELKIQNSYPGTKLSLLFIIKELN